MRDYPNNEYWICRNGKQIRYQDMSNKYLKRAVEIICDYIAQFRFKCMVNNEELYTPEWLDETVDALNNEYDRRLKDGNNG